MGAGESQVVLEIFTSYKRSPRHCLRLYRDDLDRMSESQFDFTPYAFEILPPIILNDAPLWSAEVMLIFCNMTKRHYPDRFLRQFHIRQDTPNDPLPGTDNHGNQGVSFDQPPPYYDSYQYSTQADDYVESFLNSSFYYGDTTGNWNTGGGDGAGPSMQRKM
ncbi:unnamed protein product [Cuscuta epithymum]|uniref:Aminotransferase-like plant mobile domain-containing protein n=1 Tax=Cuscuta epithymum TaxID=186058 RepID=A0AAV0FEV7_9ASTE|nr:unnamed protein product [Cuscuta epithymum]